MQRSQWRRERETDREEEAWSKIVIISCTSLVEKRIQIETHIQMKMGIINFSVGRKLTWKQQRECARDCMLRCMCKNQRVEMISNYHSLNDSMAMANMHDAHVYPGIWMTLFPVHFLCCTSMHILNIFSTTLQHAHTHTYIGVNRVHTAHYTLSFSVPPWPYCMACISFENWHYHRKSVFIYRRLNKNRFCRLPSQFHVNKQPVALCKWLHEGICCYSRLPLEYICEQQHDTIIIPQLKK